MISMNFPQLTKTVALYGKEGWCKHSFPSKPIGKASCQSLASLVRIGQFTSDLFSSFSSPQQVMTDCVILGDHRRLQTKYQKCNSSKSSVNYIYTFQHNDSTLNIRERLRQQYDPHSSQRCSTK